MKIKKFAQGLWKEIVTEGDIIIDATLGNGKDTLFLAQLLNGKGKIYAYDIQEEAIENSIKLFKHLPKDLIEIRKESHVTFVPCTPKLIVYNLGYLPGGNKNITTRVETTLQSVREGLSILSPEGAIFITCYPGHEEGRKECEALLKMAETLSPHSYSVSTHHWINRRDAPFILCIYKVPILPNSQKESNF